ncbi:hypothetical protein [Pigmentiphaga sp.]|uniref:hypothetical protein n=1 Tax=Pigmentiphaga sp. TaxID=1977564 RepID=UPI0025F9A79E|nr:hypothetical protein [Pigmentiphaga sp.]
MPRWVLYCSQEMAPTVTVDGALACEGGASSLQIGLLETTLNTPEAETVAAVWTAGFSMVVVCFLVGRAVGAVLHIIREG